MLRTCLWSIGRSIGRGLVKLDESLQKKSVLIRCMVLGGFFSAGVVGTSMSNMFHRHRLNMLRDDLVFYKEQKEAVDRASIIVNGLMERMFDKMARELTDIKGKIVNPENGKEARPKEVGPDDAAAAESYALSKLFHSVMRAIWL